jgi:cob(I)alamin adenosyltransferase
MSDSPPPLIKKGKDRELPPPHLPTLPPLPPLPLSTLNVYKSDKAPSVKIKKKPYRCGKTHLLSGERVSCNHRRIIVAGSVEEFIGSLAKFRITHYTSRKDISVSKRIYVVARLTKIQEDLFQIIKTIRNTVYTPDEGSMSKRLKSLVDEIDGAKPDVPLLETLFEVDVYSLWNISRRVERQLVNLKESRIAMVDDNIINYINNVSTYILTLP